jgi:hypothetical protein
MPTNPTSSPSGQPSGSPTAAPTTTPSSQPTSRPSWLLDNPVVNSEAFQEKTLAELAALGSPSLIAEFFEKQNSRPEGPPSSEEKYVSLVSSVFSGSSSVVELLVQKGEISVEGQNSQGFTPVMWAAHSCQLEVVKTLVKLGANAEHVNRAQQSSYDLALAAGCRSVVQYLNEITG